MIKTRTKKAVALGLLFGVSASFFAMLPTERHTEAAVAVIDQKNIEEAIKTAIQTANILTQEQKELALMILNSKKIDAAQMLGYMQTHTKQQQQIWDEHQMREGIFSEVYKRMGKDGKQTTMDGVWNERIGDLQSVLNGNMTVYTGIMNEKKREETLSSTYLDAAKSAQNAQQAGEDLAKSTQEALEASNKAEGTLQVLQNGNAINANSVLALLRLTNVYSNAVAAEAAHYQAENIRRATVEANMRETAKNSRRAGEAAYADFMRLTNGTK